MAWRTFTVIILLAGFARAEVVDITDPDHPELLTNGARPAATKTRPPPEPLHLPADRPSPRKTPKPSAARHYVNPKYGFAYDYQAGMENKFSVKAVPKDQITLFGKGIGQVRYISGTNLWNRVGFAVEPPQPVCYDERKIGAPEIPAVQQTGTNAKGACQITTVVLTDKDYGIVINEPCAAALQPAYQNVLKSFRLAGDVKPISAGCQDAWRKADTF